MKKLRRNYMMGQRQIDYLAYIKESRGVTNAEYLRRLINKEIENDEEYPHYVKLRETE